MNLLTDQERIDLMQATGVNTGSYEIAIARAIEQAVIAKLATVSVEPVAFHAHDGIVNVVSHIEKGKFLFTTEALAAARVQALEDAAR